MSENAGDYNAGDYSGSVDPSSHAHTLQGWGSDERNARLSPEAAARLQEHDEPFAATNTGAALTGDLGNAEVADESADAPQTREPDTSLGHEGGRRYHDAGR